MIYGSKNENLAKKLNLPDEFIAETRNCPFLFLIPISNMQSNALPWQTNLKPAENYRIFSTQRMAWFKELATLQPLLKPSINYLLKRCIQTAPEAEITEAVFQDRQQCYLNLLTLENTATPDQASKNMAIIQRANSALKGSNPAPITSLILATSQESAEQCLAKLTGTNIAVRKLDHSVHHLCFSSKASAELFSAKITGAAGKHTIIEEIPEATQKIYLEIDPQSKIPSSKTQQALIQLPVGSSFEELIGMATVHTPKHYQVKFALTLVELTKRQ